MNDCRYIAADLSAFVDGELPATRRAEMEAHFVVCPACRARVAELNRLAAGLAALPRVQPDRQFLAGVRERLSDQPQESVWAGWPVRVAALAVIVVGFATIFFHAPRPRGREEKVPDLAKAKAPAAVAQNELEPARRFSDEARQEKDDMAAAKALPATPPVAAKAYALGASVVLADKSETPTETIVVESEDFKQVRSDAAQVAGALNGRINIAQSISNNIYVELPARNAAMFRAQLLNQNSGANRRQFNYNQSSALDAMAPEQAGVLLTNEPLSVFEIQVVPLKK